MLTVQLPTVFSTLLALENATENAMAVKQRGVRKSNVKPLLRASLSPV